MKSTKIIDFNKAKERSKEKTNDETQEKFSVDFKELREKMRTETGYYE